MLDRSFRNLTDLVHEHAAARPSQTALIGGDERVSWRELDALVDRIAASLQRDGARVGDVLAICGEATPTYAALFLGGLRAGVAVAPLAPSVTPAEFAAMLRDCGARWLFVDAAAAALVPPDTAAQRIALGSGAPGVALADWLAPVRSTPHAAAVEPETPFNIIYSSGTTGTPKGIVQPHRMRWMHALRGPAGGYAPDTITLLATPLYSNTTLVSFFPALAMGSTLVLMPKFDAARYLELAERHRVTHTMLVPVQYQRILALPQFAHHDLSSFRMKFATSSPFPVTLKREVLARWPGGLTEYYGMTEGGGTCILEAHAHPDKLHTVGRPGENHDIRVIDDAGRELPRGATGEVVGHSQAMMTGYYGKPELTAAAQWHAPDGKRFIRTGDIGRFDADGFLTLLDRKKDMIISGGFNIYPSDLEARLREHAAVADVAVVGVPSERWGETPVAFVVPRPGAAVAASELREWVNGAVGKTQRLAELVYVDEFPRNALGKVLKRELRDRFRARSAG